MPKFEIFHHQHFSSKYQDPTYMLVYRQEIGRKIKIGHCGSLTKMHIYQVRKVLKS